MRKNVLNMVLFVLSPLIFYTVIHQTLDAFTIGSIYIEKQNDKKANVLCGNCLLKCGIFYEHEDRQVVALTEFRLTVDYPMEVIRFCQRNREYDEVHKHHHFYRTATIEHGDDESQTLLETIEPRLHSKYFFGAMFSVPCQIISPCLMGHKCDFGCNNIYQKLTEEKLLKKRLFVRKQEFPDRYEIPLQAMSSDIYYLPHVDITKAQTSVYKVFCVLQEANKLPFMTKLQGNCDTHFEKYRYNHKQKDAIKEAQRKDAFDLLAYIQEAYKNFLKRTMAVKPIAYISIGALGKIHYENVNNSLPQIQEKESLKLPEKDSAFDENMPGPSSMRNDEESETVIKTLPTVNKENELQDEFYENEPSGPLADITQALATLENDIDMNL